MVVGWLLELEGGDVIHLFSNRAIKNRSGSALGMKDAHYPAGHVRHDLGSYQPGRATWKHGNDYLRQARWRLSSVLIRRPSPGGRPRGGSAASGRRAVTAASGRPRCGRSWPANRSRRVRSPTSRPGPIRRHPRTWHLSREHRRQPSGAARRPADPRLGSASPSSAGPADLTGPAAEQRVLDAENVEHLAGNEVDEVTDPFDPPVEGGTGR